MKQTCLSMCRPCLIDHPSCKGKSNGNHANPNKNQMSPYYVTCFRNRTIMSSMCDLDQFGIRKAFKADSRSCKSIFEIQIKDGGRLPQCTSTGFTIESDPSGSCSRYYFCFSGKATFLECPKDKVFRKSQTGPVCQHHSTVCPPCGTKSGGW